MELMALVTIPKWLYLSWFALLIAGGVLFVGHVLYWFWTPGPEWIKAKLFKGPILHIFGRDNRIRYKVGKEEGSSLLKAKNLGPVITTENSAMIDQFGIVNYNVFAEFAKTLPVWWPMLLQAIREDGTKLYKWSDFEMLLKVATDEEPTTPEEKKKFNKRLEEIRTAALEEAGEEYDEEAFKAELKDLEVKLRPYKTIKLAELVNMFPHNLDPQLLEAKSELKFAEMKRKQTQWTQDKVMMYVMILLGAAVAFAIVYSMVKNGQAPTCNCGYSPGPVLEIAKNLTG